MRSRAGHGRSEKTSRLQRSGCNSVQNRISRNGWQPHFTGEAGIILSRIDRIYSNLHAVYTIVADPFATVLDREPIISSHRPLVFGLRIKGHRRVNLFPTWVTDHAHFAFEVEEEYRYLLGKSERSLCALQRLDILKNARFISAKYVKYKAAGLKA